MPKLCQMLCFEQILNNLLTFLTISLKCGNIVANLLENCCKIANISLKIDANRTSQCVPHCPISDYRPAATRVLYLLPPASRAENPALPVVSHAHDLYMKYDMYACDDK
jgi:hypothetical protein